MSNNFLTYKTCTNLIFFKINNNFVLYLNFFLFLLHKTFVENYTFCLHNFYKKNWFKLTKEYGEPLIKKNNIFLNIKYVFNPTTAYKLNFFNYFLINSHFYFNKNNRNIILKQKSSYFMHFFNLNILSYFFFFSKKRFVFNFFMMNQFYYFISILNFKLKPFVNLKNLSAVTNTNTNNKLNYIKNLRSYKNFSILNLNVFLI